MDIDYTDKKSTQSVQTKNEINDRPTRNAKKNEFIVELMIYLFEKVT